MNVSHVLVVEDDAPLAENIVDLLAPLQVQTTIASTAGQARARVTEKPYDVVLLDLMLPDGDGLELLNELRQRSPGTELVIVTGQASMASMAEAIRGRVVDYLVKPVDPLELVESVRTALARRAEDRPGLRRRDARIAAVGTLASGLAHHLRNPLNSALLQLQVARRRADQATATVIEFAEAELQRLERILRDFETCLSRSAIEREDIEVAALWSSVCDQVRAAAGANGVAIESELAPDVPTIHVDVRRMTVALVHVARNAIEAMPTGGTLTFRTRNAGAMFELEIADTGPGIADPQAVFDAFYTTKPSGTGLGLTIVHKCVLDHGGTIRIASRPGCTGLVISLPSTSGWS